MVRYDATLEDSGKLLRIRAAFPAGGPTRLMVDRGAGEFVAAIHVTGDRGERAPQVIEDTIDTPECARGCTLDYVFDAQGAAESFDDVGFAEATRGAIFAPPSTWLFHPEDPPIRARFELRFTAGKGLDFAWGCFAQGGVFAGSLEDLREPPYAAFGRMSRRALEIGGSRLDVVFVGESTDADKARVLRWITRSAEVLAAYYGRFPTPQATLFVLTGPGAQIGSGSAMGNGGASIIISAGNDATDATFDEDWVLIHEMFHLGFPGLIRRHHWAEEGMATYLEPIARAALGRKTPDAVWVEWLNQMHFGLPRFGEAGLDDTRSWGRTYWGGALFWFMVDRDVREKSGSRRSIRDAMRAVLEDGGNISQRWTIDRLLSTIDRATETDSASRIYREHALRRGDVDLDKLFLELGVRTDGLHAIYDDAAPLAAVRREMVKAPPDRDGGVKGTR